MLCLVDVIGSFPPPETPKSGGCWGRRVLGWRGMAEGPFRPRSMGDAGSSPCPHCASPQALGFSQALLQEFSSCRPLPPTSGNHEWSNGMEIWAWPRWLTCLSPAPKPGAAHPPPSRPRHPSPCWRHPRSPIRGQDLPSCWARAGDGEKELELLRSRWLDAHRRHGLPTPLAGATFLP